MQTKRLANELNICFSNSQEATKEEKKKSFRGGKLPANILRANNLQPVKRFIEIRLEKFVSLLLCQPIGGGRKRFPTNGVHGLESLILLRLRFRFFAISSGAGRGHSGRHALCRAL